MPKMILKSVYCAIFVICITISAAYFDKSALLWWYIAPLLVMLCDSESKEKNNTEKK